MFDSKERLVSQLEPRKLQQRDAAVREVEQHLDAGHNHHGLAGREVVA